MDHSVFHLCYFILSKTRGRRREKPWQSLFEIPSPFTMYAFVNFDDIHLCTEYI